MYITLQVGLPAKSGVAGAILLVVPNVMGICTWSPPLDQMGNSCRGVQFCEVRTDIGFPNQISLRVRNYFALQWRHNGRDGVSNHQPHDCLLNRLFRCRSKKTSKLRVTSLCAGNSPVTGEFPAQMASNVENVSIWWRHHGMVLYNVSNILA